MPASVTLQQISGLLDQRFGDFEQKMDQKLNQKFDEKLAPIYKILEEHTKLLNEHTKLLNEHSKILEKHTALLNEHTKLLNKHSKILKQHSKQLRVLKKDQDAILSVLDREQMHQHKRLDRVEDHLGLPPLIA